MAKTLVFFTIFILLSFLTTADFDGYSRSILPSELGMKKEQITHLHFYVHDNESGPNPTAIRVARAPSTKSSKITFGDVFMLDDPLTVGPESGSKMIGKAQGIYALASQTEIGLLMVLNFVFTDGNFSGSNLSLLGRNAIYAGVREMPIVGGSGAFRFSRGYAEAKTYSFNTTTKNAIVEFNVYVLHQ